MNPAVERLCDYVGEVSDGSHIEIRDHLIDALYRVMPKERLAKYGWLRFHDLNALSDAINYILGDDPERAKLIDEYVDEHKAYRAEQKEPSH